MEKRIEAIGLLSGDKPLIAEALGVSQVTVADTLKERRGKRATLIQLKIKRAAAYCIQKNREKMAFCLEMQTWDTNMLGKDVLTE